MTRASRDATFYDMCLLIVIGLGLTAAAFSANPILGVVVAFLFLGGAGWKILAGLASMTVLRLTKTGRRAYGPEGRLFIAEWERRSGEMVFGHRSTQPPPGAFKAWIDSHDTTGISAGDWLDREMGRPPVLSAGRFHAAWTPDGRGATYIPEDNGRYSAHLDPGIGDDIWTGAMMERGWDELAIAHGEAPMFGAKASSTPIVWTPPLPEAEADTAPSN